MFSAGRWSPPLSPGATGPTPPGQYAYQLLAFFLNPNAEFGSASSLSFAGRPRPEPVTASAAAASWMRSSAAAFFAVAKPVALQLLRLLRAALCAATAFLAEALPGGYVPEGAVSKVCSAGGQELASEPPVVAADSSTRIARAAMGAASRFYNKINLQELLYGGQTSDDSEDVAVFRCSAKDLAFTQADVGIIIGLYVLWQFLYYVKTEVLDAPLLDADPAISTSLRWISADRKHPMNKLFDFLMKKIGVMRKDEHFDSKTIKTKVIFIVGQLVYTVLTMAPVAIFINWWGGDIAFLTLIFCVTVYNAGGFYMQIFSKRYESGLEKKHLETRAQVAKELRESQGGADDANSVTSSSAASTSSVMDDLSNWEEANGSGNGNVAAADAASPSAPKKSTSKRKRRSRRGNSAASSEKSTPPTTDDDNAYESDMLSDYEDFEEFKSAVYDDENVALRTAALLDPSTPLSKG
uniref:Glycerophosphocholine acyltransferase 1 n=1 Tax=Phaeomonas parva TaxID=124430 RepID=A0A7S1XQ73_9STRA